MIYPSNVPVRTVKILLSSDANPVSAEISALFAGPAFARISPCSTVGSLSASTFWKRIS